VSSLNQRGEATVKKKVSMGVVVKRADGSVEDLGTQNEQIVELTKDQLAAMIGDEAAAEVFRGVTEEGEPHGE